MLRRSDARPRLGGGRAVAAVARPAVARILGAAAIVVLAVPAALADAAAPAATAWSVAADLAVALAFTLAAATMPGPATERVLVLAIGAAWLLGSWWPAAALSHRSLLAAALLCFPSGRLHGRARWVLLGLALPLASGFVPQPAVAAVFAATAVVSLPRKLRPAAAWFPAASATAVAGVLVGSWAVSRIDPLRFDPSLGLLVYQLTLVLIAAGFLLAAREVIAAKARLADRVLTDEALAGLDGLAVVLADALGDPQLQVYRWLGPRLRYRTVGGEPYRRDARRHVLQVHEGGQPVAAVVHRSAALDDPWIARAITSAVRSTLVHLRRTEELQTQLVDLEAARDRMLRAADRQREATAARLREDVVVGLRAASADLRSVLPTIGDPDASDALRIVVQELDRTEREVMDLVAGVPPVSLGRGRLHAAIESLVQHSGTHVTVSAASDAVGDAAAETALFYVCSEAVSNALKHAGPTRIDITLDSENDYLVLSVADDGRGCADPGGSGLLGLADRMAASGGRLRVDSPPGAGTTVTARVRKFSSTV